jgi:ribosomal protein S17E
MKKTIKQQRKDMLKKYEGELEGPHDHLKEGVDYLDDIQRNKETKKKWMMDRPY